MSRKDPGLIVSGAGWIASFAEKLTSGLRAQGWSNDQIHTLVTDEGDETIDKIVEAFLASVRVRRVTEVAVVGTTKFVAADAFGPDNPNGIRFYLWENFKKHFLGKIEENVEQATIAVHRLEKSSRNPEIMAELDVEKRVIKLAHFYELIKAQAQGQEGSLLVNGYANIAYIEDDKRTLWAVRANWHPAHRGWDVRVPSVESPCEWDVGSQVLSQV